jgi:predicted RNA-binding Zn-ribbon protein involved in translation (DUF1610 family)
MTNLGAVRELVEAAQTLFPPDAGIWDSPRMERLKLALARFHQPEQPCPECGGNGQRYAAYGTYAASYDCPRCHGTGTIPPEQPTCQEKEEG